MSPAGAAPTKAGGWGILACVLLFSTALGVTAVAFPLRALDAGYGAATVGYLGALGAGSQLAVRAVLPWVIRRVPDRWLIRSACGLMMASGLALVASDTLPALLLMATLLGAARALFWTGSQIYVLRGDTAQGQRSMSHLQFTSAAGEFIGPLLGGLVAEWSLLGSVWLWVGCGLGGLAPAAFLTRFAPLKRVDRQQVGPVWRQRNVVTGCAAVVTAGGWRGLLSSLVPAVLADVGRLPGQIGVLVAVANACSMLGSLAAGRVPARWIAVVVYLGIVVTGFSLGAVGIAATSVILAGLALAVSGVGSGLLQTLGTVLAAAAVPEAQRGDVVVLTGLLRSIALLAVPAAVAALVGAVAAPVALAIGGGMLIAPIAIRVRRNRSGPPT